MVEEEQGEGLRCVLFIDEPSIFCKGQNLPKWFWAHRTNARTFYPK